MATKRVADMTPEEHARLKEQRKKWKKKKYVPVSELSEEEKNIRRKKQKEYARKRAIENPSSKLIFQRNKLISKLHLPIVSLINTFQKINNISCLIKVLNKILSKKKANKYAKEKYWENPEKFREKRRKWIDKNREKKRLSDKEYNAKRQKSDEYKIKCNKRRKLYQQTHKLEISEKRKLDRQLHPEKYAEQRRRYRERHLEEIKMRAKKYRKTHMHTEQERAKRSRNDIYLNFEKYASRLSIDEEPIKDDNGCLMVRDFYTKEYFYPKKMDVINRIIRLEGKASGECHLYASEKSKKSCPVYRAHKRPRFIRVHHKPSPARDPAWRGMVLARANGHCERCGKECDSLIAHHKIPVKTCEMFSADIDNGMALCPECHREVHSTDGCRLHELAAEKRKTA